MATETNGAEIAPPFTPVRLAATVAGATHVARIVYVYDEATGHRYWACRCTCQRFWAHAARWPDGTVANAPSKLALRNCFERHIEEILHTRLARGQKV